MKIVITSVEIEKNANTTYWRIVENEVFEAGDEARIWGTVVDGVIQYFPLSPGQHVEHVVQMPHDQVLYRAAEYGIDPNDIDTLLDVVVCERFITREWWAGDDHLFAAGSIDEARRLYLIEIARIKLKYRISTRSADKSEAGHPLNILRNAHVWKPADLALKTMGTLLLRHRNGAQALEPTVLKSLLYMESALAVHPDTDNSVSSGGYSA